MSNESIPITIQQRFVVHDLYRNPNKIHHENGWDHHYLILEEVQLNDVGVDTLNVFICGHNPDVNIMSVLLANPSFFVPFSECLQS